MISRRSALRVKLLLPKQSKGGGDYSNQSERFLLGYIILYTLCEQTPQNLAAQPMRYVFTDREKGMKRTAFFKVTRLIGARIASLAPESILLYCGCVCSLCLESSERAASPSLPPGGFW